MIPPEILALIAAYRSCDPEDAEAMLYALMRERGPTLMLPFLIDLHGEAKMWAENATIPELEAYAEAAIDQLDETPSGRRLRVHRAFKAIQALQPKDLKMLLERLRGACGEAAGSPPERQSGDDRGGAGQGSKQRDGAARSPARARTRPSAHPFPRTGGSAPKTGRLEPADEERPR